MNGMNISVSTVCVSNIGIMDSNAPMIVCFKKLIRCDEDIYFSTENRVKCG